MVAAAISCTDLSSSEAGRSLCWTNEVRPHEGALLIFKFGSLIVCFYVLFSTECSIAIFTCLHLQLLLKLSFWRSFYSP